MEPLKEKCQTCGKEFWIIKQEREFLQKMNLPNPSNCPGCRELRRLKERGERSLYKTSCQKCGKNIIVTYNSKTEIRKILCKECCLEWFEKNPILIND